MSMVEYDDISNKTIAAHLTRQDVAIANLTDLLQDSITDRKGIHKTLGELVAERERLVREGQMYQKAIEERLGAVEARDDLQKIRYSLDELVRANSAQLALHRWLTHNRVKARALTIFGLALVPLLSQLIGVIFHHLGWQ